MSYALFRIGKVWHYRYQVNGERVQRSSRETVRSRADAIASKAYDEAKLWAHGSEPIPTLTDLAKLWLKVHDQTASDAHIKAVDTFERLHLYQLRDVLISEITKGEVEVARNRHLESHAPASANHWLSILKLLVNWAVERKIIPLRTWKVKMLKVQKKPRVMLPMLSAKAWFAAVDRQTGTAPNVATCIRLMFGLGLRESEAAGARWEWIDWERQTYTPGKTKGREAEPVPMPMWLVVHLQPKAKTAGLIAPSSATGSAGGREYAPGFARKAMRAANDECGLKGLTPHRLRGTFATMLSEAGVPIQTIQKVMRHKDPMTTMKYLEKNFELAARAQAAMAEKMGFEATPITNGLLQPGCTEANMTDNQGATPGDQGEIE